MTLESLPKRPARRTWLKATAIAATGASPFAFAQPSLRLAQLVDTSSTQQELSRDYTTGLQLAWTESRGRRGAGNDVSIIRVETDGSDTSIAAAFERIWADRSIVGMLGSIGDRVAVSACERARNGGTPMAHIAPWMADSKHDNDDGVLCLFPSRSAQLRKALLALQGMGVAEVQAVFASESDLNLLRGEIESATSVMTMRLSLIAPRANEDIRALGARLNTTKGVVIYTGSSPELALLTQAMSSRGDRRFVVGLADSDYNVVRSLGVGVGIPLVLTQVVPNPQTSKLDGVRTYRALLKELFDEPPSPLSLAGYFAGQYAARLLRGTTGALSRESLLAEARRRPSHDLGGFRIDFQGGTRGSVFVDQVLVRGDGRLVG
jgi:ABC-type branched-subunit amino acid transport system substrate-binding protein